ncbi:MAG: bifunctional pyr operon transcriptional regulator/uracil phosphoribosyltransferase PyrR [Paenibacillaceae bacterium]|nr:bifunctional pyr operon transcriptional regulator/uracil phosphoribosyltransferase PyrR [Paenibacillaceae bacterium]
MHTVVMDAEMMRRALTRIAHEIIERHRGQCVFVGVRTRGVDLARRTAAIIARSEGIVIPVCALDVRMYRDDIAGQAQEVPRTSAGHLSLLLPIKDQTVMVFDDVLYTGRTVRAALDAIIAHGRPQAIQLSVLIDRGHRELPIRADFVGKNIPTAKTDAVEVCVQEVDGIDEVRVIKGVGS